MLFGLGLLVACAKGAEPAAAVEGFLGGLNKADWEKMKSFMAKETLEQLAAGGDEVRLRSELFDRLAGLGGRVEYKIERTAISGDRAQVLVSGTVVAPVLNREITEVVSFFLAREEGAWKLLPKLTVGDIEYDDAVGMVRHLLAPPR